MSGESRGRPRDPGVDDAVRAAVRRLLATDGLDGVTYEAVARETGVSRPTIYRRYPRRSDLVFEAGLPLATPPPDYLRPGSPAVPDTGSLRGDLAAIARLAMASFDGLERAGLLRGFMSALVADPQFAQRLWVEAVGPAQAVLVGVVRRWVERGVVDAGVDVDLALEVFPAMMIYRRVLLDRPMSDAEIDELVGYVHRALGADERHS